MGERKGGKILLSNAIKVYTDKNDFLIAQYPELKAKEFYRALFPVGSFERAGHSEDMRPNGLALDIRGQGKAYHFIITDELDIENLLSKDFVIMSAISYFGNRRTGENARYLYALTFDIDGVEVRNLRDILKQAREKFLPMPTYIVNSGGGVHLYYQFTEPIPMYPHFQQYLRKLKHCLTKIIWNDYTSNREDIEYQSILQGFRMVGSPSKLGKEYPVRAFAAGNKVDLEYLYSFLWESDKKELGHLSQYKQGKISLEKAKELYPEWYQNTVIEKRRGRWHIKRDLYDWWLQRIENEIKLHHRYFAIMTLAIYAKKCDIEEEELRRDAYRLLDVFERLTETEDNHFTKDDIEAALSMYNEDYITFPRDNIARLTDLFIKENKRNGRPQNIHLQRIRALQNFDYPNKEWINRNGRPITRDVMIRDYLIENPSATKTDIKRNLGISYTTIAKYYDTMKTEALKIRLNKAAAEEKNNDER